MEIHIRGFKMTVETPKEGIEAEILVVSNLQQLEQYKDEVKLSNITII